MAWWEDYPLVARHLRAGEAFTVGIGGDMAVEGDLWGLVRAEEDRAIVDLRDGAEVFAGAPDRVTRVPYRESPRDRVVELARGDRAAVRLGRFRVVVAVEPAEVRPPRSGSFTARMFGAIATAASICGTTLGVSAFTVPPMVQYCDQRCDIQEQARLMRPYFVDDPSEPERPFALRAIAPGDAPLHRPSPQDEYCAGASPAPAR